jgi:hypothetical protein
MNSEKIVELFLDGAYLEMCIENDKFYHPSFRKGWRIMSSSNISFLAAKKKLHKIGKPVQYQDKKYFL